MEVIENEGKGLQYVKKIPPGWKFLPTDEEIIFEYLHKRILNEKLPCEDVIKEVHLYELDIPDLATLRKTKLTTEIEHNGKKIGVKNTLNFYWGLQQGENSRTEWMMREYSIKEFQIPKEPAGLEPHMKLDDAVL
ncbi:uncharacterized protein A4U43_C06F19970 [Asparagus officinalis]|uniref:NAC domain-containing protein n=1 Tax=Asparagus officinalis TaxID=4686 RepID=A0A5P1EP28_ASPOF|nr:uncharacterized protein A4U43_C06F19970 [Asparagus officinalis]